VELLTGLSYVLIWRFFASDLVLLALNLILISVCILILVYDIRHTIIPDELVLMVLSTAILLLAYDGLPNFNWQNVWLSLLGGTIAAFFFWGLWYISNGRWIGLGDAKLAFPLGMIAGTSGIFSMVVFSFWIGASISLLLLALERLTGKGKTRLHFLASPLTIRSEVPFAPFLIAGFFLVHLFHVDIFKITYILFWL
jgi:prepilin signal peptidase PulO-like enzyme (type II secretory pathway)